MEEDFDVAVPMDRAATQTVSQQKKKETSALEMLSTGGNCGRQEAHA